MLASFIVVAVALPYGQRSTGFDTPATARADEPIRVNGTPSVDNKFPAEVIFSVDASAVATDVTDVQLHYTLLPSGTIASGRAEFDKGKTVHAEYHLRTAGNPLYLPPTKVLRYYWSVQDAAGNHLETQPVDWMYQDTRFKFKTAENGNLTLFYYNGSDANAQRLLGIGRAALDKAGALVNAPIDFPVHLVVYGTRAEAGQALSHESKSVDPNILGQANAPDIVVLVAGDLSGADNEDTVRHELTHLVNARAVQGAYSSALPLWLDEGLAVYGQKDPGGFAAAVDQAIRRDSAVPLKTLSPGYRGTNPDLFYGEAWSIVRFLVATYGPDKFAQLMGAFKNGATEDAAFSSVYGADRDGVYQQWRKGVGLSASVPAAPAVSPAPVQSRNAASPAATAEGSVRQPSATTASGAAGAVVPTQPPAPNPNRNAGTSGSDNTLTTVIVAVGAGAGVLALLIAAIFGGLALSRRGRV